VNSTSEVLCRRRGRQAFAEKTLSGSQNLEKEDICLRGPCQKKQGMEEQDLDQIKGPLLAHCVLPTGGCKKYIKNHKLSHW
jgi:hypothetical protein